MIQSLEDLNNTISIINEKLLVHRKMQVQKVFSSPHFIIFQCRVPQETIYLYIGRGVNHQGAFIARKNVPSSLRVKDIFVDYARKYWRSSTITSIETRIEDRVLCISGYQNKEEYKAAFFWRGRDLFFAHFYYENKKLYAFRNWVGKELVEDQKLSDLSLEGIFSNLGFGSAKRKGKSVGDINDYIEMDLEKVFKLKEGKKVLKKRNRLTSNMLKDLNKLKEGLELIKYVDSSDLSSLDEIGKGRFKIKLYEIDGHYKKRDLIYEKVKQWKNSYAMLEKRLNKAKNDILNDKKEEFDLKEHIVKPIWITKKNSQSSFVKHSNYIQFSYRNSMCYLGRSSSENDYIRNKISKKTDLWVHLDNVKSGHLFIRGEKPNVEDLRILSSALVDLCNIDLLEFQIIYTEVANLKAVKGQRGSVTFKKEKRLLVFFDQEWKKKVEIVSNEPPKAVI